MSTITIDERPIQSAWSTGEEPIGAAVGYCGVTRIESYSENEAVFPHLPWLKVWKGDVLIARLNCAHMAEITYADEDAEETH